MNASSLSHHALTRMNQRAIREADVDLIKLIGTEVPDGFIVLDRDRQAAERALQLLLDRVRRLGGARMVVAGMRVVTVYRAEKQKERRLVRRAEERDLAGDSASIGRGAGQGGQRRSSVYGPLSVG